MHEPLTIVALHPSGFEVHLHVPSLDALEATLADLLQRGYRPARSGNMYETTPEGAPICPKHRVPMRLRQKQHEEWWSHRVINPQTGEELYCKGYKAPSSPGWEIDDANP